MTDFSIDYFIKKFQSLPPNAIGSGAINNHCALYHCGVQKQSDINDESKQLAACFRPLFNDIPYGDDNAMIWHVNDGTDSRHWIDDTGIWKYDNSKLNNRLCSLLPKERLILCLQIVKHQKENPSLSIIECINLFI